VQSHLLEVRTVATTARSRWGPRPGAHLSGRAVNFLTCEQSVLLGPVQRQIEFPQTRRGELDGLPALEDGLDKFRA